MDVWMDRDRGEHRSESRSTYDYLKSAVSALMMRSGQHPLMSSVALGEMMRVLDRRARRGTGALLGMRAGEMNGWAQGREAPGRKLVGVYPPFRPARSLIHGHLDCYICGGSLDVRGWRAAGRDVVRKAVRTRRLRRVEIRRRCRR